MISPQRFELRNRPASSAEVDSGPGDEDERHPITMMERFMPTQTQRPLAIRSQVREVGEAPAKQIAPDYPHDDRNREYHSAHLLLSTPG